MTDLVSKLLTPEILVEIIQLVEGRLPGWWYSLYQHESGLVELRGGASYACPDDFSRWYATTKEGDTGFRIYVDITNPDIVQMIRIDIEKMLTEAALFMNGNDSKIPDQSEKPRIQSKDDLITLQTNYQDTLVLLRQAGRLGFTLKEFHLGSCTLSADCTIRGTLHGKSIGYPNDILDGGLGDSLWYSVVDLLVHTSGYTAPDIEDLNEPEVHSAPIWKTTLFGMFQQGFQVFLSLFRKDKTQR